MENPVKKYKLEQDGKEYNLSTQIYQDKFRLVCIELNQITPLVFVGEFSLNELMQLSPIFASISTISQADEIFDKIITTQKMSIESNDNYIFLRLMVKTDQIESNFAIKLNLFTKKESNNVQTNIQPILENQNQSLNQIQNQMESQQQSSSNQFFSFATNDINTGNMGYSTTNNSINGNNNISSSIPEQYTQTQFSQNQNLNNENIMLNAMNNAYSKEILQTVKKKRKRIDKLTLSLRAVPDNDNNNQYVKDLMKSLSPQKEEPEIQNTPLFRQQQNIVETNIKTYEINNREKDIEIENLKNENKRLKEIINQLKTQIEILVQENQNLKLKYENMIKNMPNGNQSSETILIKEENERYIKEIDLLRNQLNEFNEYKRIKEEEITNLKIQIEEVIENSKRIEEYARRKEKEIEELKFYIEELIRNQKINESQFRKLSRQNRTNEVNLEDQMLSIQDTRLEVVKGDIIQDVKELELLSRKISKNNRKIFMNLLYKATIDSDKAEVFHQKCDNAKSTLVLVQSENGKRFGGYTTCNWKGNSIEKKDNNAFVFSLDKMKIYDIILGEDAIGCYPKYGPVFLGCQIRIYDEFFTQGGTTYEKGMNYNTEEDYELTGGLKKFGVKEVEVYSVDLE